MDSDIVEAGLAMKCQEVGGAVGVGQVQAGARGREVPMVLGVEVGREEVGEVVVVLERDGSGDGRQERVGIVEVVEAESCVEAVAAEVQVDGEQLDAVLAVFDVVGTGAM